MSLGSRIKEIRKNAINKETGKIGYTQTEFADALQMSRSFISQAEIDVANISDRTIKDICRLCNANEDWLRTGSGEMFKEITKHEAITDFFADVLQDEPDTFRFRLINALAELPVEEWEMLADLCEKIVNSKNSDAE